jgi:hypothetical protein
VHIEWQVKNDKTMPARMLFYHALNHLIHKMPVEGFVIYIGKHRMNMKDEIVHGSLRYKYKLIDLTSISPEEFLSSDVPEEVLLAVLAGKTKKEEKREIIKKILAKLHIQLKDNTAALSRKLVQLEILGDLRNVQNIIIEEENKMATLYELYDIKRDIRYKQGIEAGVEKSIKNLLLKTQLSLKEIADITEAPVTFVETIKNSLPKKNHISS